MSREESTGVGSAGITEQVQLKQVSLLYRQATGGLTVNLIVSYLLCLMLWEAMPHGRLITWFAVTGCVVLARLTLVMVYRRWSRRVDVRDWRNWFIIGSTANGIMWGIAGTLFFPIGSPLHQLFLIIILSGMAGGAVVFLSPVLLTYILYVIPTLFPASVILLLQGTPVHISMGIAGFVYLGGILFAAYRTHVLVRDSLTLGIEKESLVAKLNQEVIEQKRMEQALCEEKERAEVTLASIGDAVITTDAKGIVQYLNPVAESLTGWSIREARGRTLGAVLHVLDEQTREPAPSALEQCLENGRVVELVERSLLISRFGNEIGIKESAAPIRNRNGEMWGVVIVFKDVSEERSILQEMAYLAKHDTLTGLVNRREFEQRLEHVVMSSKVYGGRHTLGYLDLDHFKIVNDTAGHAAGDELLKQVAGLLKSAVRERDALARLGGDEFGLLLDNCTLDKAMQIANVLVAKLKDFGFTWKGRTFQIGISIGLVPITTETESTAQLLSQADVACYTAKGLGRNQVYPYQAEDSERNLRHNEILPRRNCGMP